MKTVHIDDATKEQALEYANTQADLQGIERGSAQWKKFLEKYLGFAYSTMSVGRNPRATSREQIDQLTELYPTIFDEKIGFLGRISKSREEYQANSSRLIAAVKNITYLIVENVAGVKSDKKEAGMQFPQKGSMPEDRYNEVVADVIQNWVLFDIVEGSVYNALSVPLGFRKSDLDFIKDKFIISEIDTKKPGFLKTINSVRFSLMKMIQNKVGKAFASIDYLETLAKREINKPSQLTLYDE